MTRSRSNIDFTKILTFLESEKSGGMVNGQKRMSILDGFFTKEADTNNAELQQVTSQVAESAFTNGCRSKLREARAILNILRTREKFINKLITRWDFLKCVETIRRSYEVRKG